MPRLHISHWTLPRSFPSLRATLATQKSPKKSNRTIEASIKRRFQLSPVQKPPESPSQSPREKPSSPDAVSDALRDTYTPDNNLLAPVHVSEDPDGVLKEKHPAAQILSNSAIVIQRKLELMNLTIGLEQANKYVILDPQGNHLGFIAERDLGIGNAMVRQMFKTHRSFETHVFDKHEREVLRFHRPFSWISSNIGVYDPLEASSSSPSPSSALIRTSESDASGAPIQVSHLALSEMRLIGDAQQQWAPLRRKYNLSLFRQTVTPEVNLGTRRTLPGNPTHSRSQQLELSQAALKSDEGEFSQFAYVDEPFLSWDFSLLSADSRLIGSVNRNFAGFGREIFTDTGVYALRMDAAGLAKEPRHEPSKTGEQNEIIHKAPVTSMSLDQRAVMLATAVSIDFDYFSRKSSSSDFIPMWLPFWAGDEAAEAGSQVAGAEAAGSALEGGAVVAGSVAKEASGDLEGQAVVGATAMGGYEAMQRGGHRNDSSSDAGQTQHSGSPGAGPGPTQQDQGEGVWGEASGPWSAERSGPSGGRGEGKGSDSEGGGGDGGGEGGGGGSWPDIFF